MADLVARLQTTGLRLTAQRRVVAEVLDGENVHLSADEVLARAQDLLPEIGRATVYKALTEFVAVGSVREIQVGCGPKRFDPNAHIDHHHLRCRTCDRLWDQPVQDDWLEPPTVATVTGFEVESAEVTYIGLCDGCRALQTD